MKTNPKEVGVCEKMISTNIQELSPEIGDKIERYFEVILQTMLTDFQEVRAELFEIINERRTKRNTYSHVLAINSLLRTEINLINVVGKIRVKKEEVENPGDSVWNDVYERAKANRDID